ncbi:tripartite tricarboxylate transporter substrate binding protein [soil metagenome]
MKTFTKMVLGASMVCAAFLAQAQPYPNKPIRLVVPFGAGGPSDALARAVGQSLTASMGQMVLVDNKPGANTIIGADTVAKSPPDGYTLLLATDATYSINPLVYSKLPYNPQKDLIPLVAVAHLPEYLMIGSQVPAKTLPEFIAYAKANPGKVTYGSFGIGSNAHLAGEAFKAATGIDMVHVPYKGAAEVIPAIVSGQIDAVFTSPNQALPFIKEGKMRALGTSAPQRMAQLPDVPTYIEQGIKGLDVNVWFGFFAPANTPPQIVQQLSEQIDKVVSSAEFRDRHLTPFALVPAPAGQAYFEKILKADVDRYARYVKIANVKLD